MSSSFPLLPENAIENEERGCVYSNTSLFLYAGEEAKCDERCPHAVQTDKGKKL
jgi:hypothetical protein